VVGIAMLAFWGTGIAAPALVGTTTDPTGIDDLVVDGVTYNVTFSTTAFDSPFARGTTASQDAANAIATVFFKCWGYRTGWDGFSAVWFLPDLR